MTYSVLVVLFWSFFLTAIMMLHCLFLFSTILGGSFQNSITPKSNTVHDLKGSDVVLSCSYSATAGFSNSLHWYRQYPRSKPEFLLLILEGTGSVQKATPPDPRLSAKLDMNNKRVDLEISSAKVTDSALYYCALTKSGVNKLIFGEGTRLTIESSKPSSPKYYKLKSKDDAVSACLATDFSAYNATDEVDPFNRTKTNPTRIDKDPFDKVVILTKDIEKCHETNVTETDVCDSGAGGIIETDEKINFLSLTILGLRILFLKSIVFNVLMTLRAWMS